MSILIAAGHGPVAPGAVYLDFAEHGEALLWRDLIIAKLRARGASAEAVPVLSLKEKVRWINDRCRALGACIALEVHFNAGGTPGRTRGCETLYMPRSERGAVLADLVQEAMAPLFPPSRGIKEAWYRQDHPHRVDFPGDVEGDEIVDYFVRATVCPAVIIEPDFVYERDRIVANREPACRELADALIRAHEILCVRAGKT